MIKQIDDLIEKYGKMNYLLLIEQKLFRKNSLEYRSIDRERKTIGFILKDLVELNSQLNDEKILNDILNLKVGEHKSLNLFTTIRRLCINEYIYTNEFTVINMNKDQMIEFFKTK